MLNVTSPGRLPAQVAGRSEDAGFPDPRMAGSGGKAADEEMHPLLMLYPFDAPGTGTGRGVEPESLCAAPTPGELPREVSFEDDLDEEFDKSLTQALAELASGDLDDEALMKESMHPADTGAAYQPAPRRRRNPHPARTKRQGGGKPGGLWARHGMLFGLMAVANAVSSYQVAVLYRHAARVETSAWALCPAVFLTLLLPVLAAIFLLAEQREEFFAVSMLWLLVCLMMVGLICKVLLILLSGA